MRISRLKIDNYGPVRDLDWELESGINLFFGSNESGKTLIVESIVKLLLDGNTADFEGINRVQGKPAGFLLVDAGEESVQVPDADYTDLFPNETNASDIRNAFVIRDVDLRIPKRKREFGQSSYFRDVTDRIMGAQTQKIESIQERIAELGNLANKDSTQLMNRKPKKLKQRRDTAEVLAGELAKYLSECREEGILETIQAKRNAEQELVTVKRNISELERAKKQQQLELGRELVQELHTVKKTRKEHTERQYKISDHRELLQRIDAYRDSESDVALDPGTYRNAAVVVTPLFALSLIATIVSPGTGMGIIAGVLLLVLLYLGYKYFEARNAVVERDEIVEEANFAGFEGDDLPTVYLAIDEAIKTYETERQHLSRQWSETIGNLKGTFDTDHDSLAAWERVLDEFADDVDHVDREFDEAELKKLQDQRRTLRENIENLRGNLAKHREKLSGFDSKMQEIGPDDYLADVEDVQIKSVEDLREAKHILERFVSELNETRDHARTAIEIFEELEEAEEQEINQLFTEDDFIVNTFRRVTTTNYTDVWYDEGETTIRVESTDGRTLTPYELSQGTYDLLYLTIRLKLAKKLLNDETGFLILDDAFVHSDSERTLKEIQVLDQLASEGWQIIYFSFRDTVKDAVNRSENGSIINLQSLDFTP